MCSQEVGGILKTGRILGFWEAASETELGLGSLSGRL